MGKVQTTPAQGIDLKGRYKVSNNIEQQYLPKIVFVPVKALIPTKNSSCFTHIAILQSKCPN